MLETTREERDLGVVMSDTLKHKAQCAKAARTAQTVLSQIVRAFHFRDKHIFLKLPQAVQTVCPTPLGVCGASLVTVDSTGKRGPGEGAAESGQHDFWT